MYASSGNRTSLLQAPGLQRLRREVDVQRLTCFFPPGIQVLNCRKEGDLIVGSVRISSSLIWFAR